MVNEWMSFIQSCLYPSICILCGDRSRRGMDLCAACEADLPVNSNPCPQCAHPLPALARSKCGRCLRQAPAFDQAVVPFQYLAPFDQLICGLKFSAKLHYARTLSALLGAHLAVRSELNIDLIVPVPLHRQRQWMRGFNQAVELARPIGRRLSIPVQTRGFRRVRATHAQATLATRARRRNLRDAFAVAGCLQGRRIAVVDDVVTTATTVNEFAKALKSAGAQWVEVWAVARTLHNR